MTNRSMTYFELATAALDLKGGSVHHDLIQPLPNGGMFKLPSLLRPELSKFAIITADDPATERQSLPYIPSTAASGTQRILSGINALSVRDKTGFAPVGSGLPSASMLNETDNSTASDPSFSRKDYSARTIESSTETSLQLLLQGQASPIDNVIENAQREALFQLLVDQMLEGDGTGNNLLGLNALPNVLSATYTVAQNGSVQAFIDAEDSALSGDANESELAWVVGGTLHAAMRSAIEDPGSGRRTIERRVIRTSGTPVIRSNRVTATTAYLIDLSDIYVIVQTGADGCLESGIETYANRVSRPGSLLLSSRIYVDVLFSDPTRHFALRAA